MRSTSWMFHVLLTLAVLPGVLGRPFPVAVGAAGTLRADVLEPDLPATGEQKLLRRELPGTTSDGAALLEAAPAADAKKGDECVKDQVAYALLSDGSLCIIDMGPNTVSGKTEVRRLTKVSDFKEFKDDNPVQTRMHLTASNNDNGEWTFLVDGTDNLVAINSGMTDSNMTEVHRLKFAGDLPWQEIDVNVVTALPLKSLFEEWDFLLDSESNLMIIKKGPSTPSTMTELHKLSGSQGYQNFLLQTATGMPLSASTTNHGEWSYLLDGMDNLLCIKRPTKDDKSVTVKRLTAGSNYHSFDFENGGTDMPETPDADADVHWVFEIDSQDDILCILEGPSTQKGKTELHKLSKVSNYTKWTMHQPETGAPCRQPLFTDAGGV